MPQFRAYMHSDSFFFKGKTHDINEDYAISGFHDVGNHDIPFAIVCDGCSGSKDTDFGARVIAKEASNQIEKLTEPSIGEFSFGLSVISQARKIITGTGWDQNCLDATLLVAASSSTRTYIQAIGDGVIVLIDDEFITIHDITYPSGAPRYLNYWNDPHRSEVYENKYSNKRIVKTHRICGDIINTTENESESPCWSTHFLNDSYKKVVLLSDGVHSFQKLVTGNGKVHQPIDMMDILNELISFKTTKGEFVKRRVKRFIKNMDNIENNDDLSVAAICI
jgi:serine/threonine protein phosphatase PrpC